jgi:hypothetical protein
MRCAAAARKKVGGTDEGADGVMHGLCGGVLLACDRRGWGGMKPDTVEEARLHEQRRWGGAPLSRGRESGKQKMEGLGLGCDRTTSKMRGLYYKIQIV